MKQCVSHLSNSITLNGFAYKMFTYYKNNTDMKSYYCEKKFSKKCRAKVTLYSNGRKIHHNKHRCRNKPNVIAFSWEIIEYDEHNQQRQSESDIENVNFIF